MGFAELAAKDSEAAREEQVLLGGGVVTIRAADAREVITATKYATSGDEGEFALALAALSIVDGDGSRPLVDQDGSLVRGMAEIRNLRPGVQLDLRAAALRVNGFARGN